MRIQHTNTKFQIIANNFDIYVSGFLVYRFFCRLGSVIKWTKKPDFNCCMNQYDNVMVDNMITAIIY